MFDEVYKIVTETNDLNELRKKLEGHFLEAVAKKNGLLVTVAAQLAREGQHEKVEWMRQLGASANYIAGGYALAGNHEQVEIYRSNYNADIDIIAICYANVNNHERVERYRTQYEANIDWIAHGYAVAGNHERVETYRTLYEANVYAIAMGYAIADNHERVEWYRTQYKADIDLIAFGYALAGNHERVDIYHAQFDANVDNIIAGYEMAGCQEKKNQYTRIAIDNLLDNYLTQRTAVKDAEGLTKEYFYGSFFSAFQKSFTQKSNAVAALKSALRGEDVDLSEHLSTLRNGELGNTLRAFVKSGKADALVDRNVFTVSEFVEALQSKCPHGAQFHQ